MYTNTIISTALLIASATAQYGSGSYGSPPAGGSQPAAAAPPASSPSTPSGPVVAAAPGASGELVVQVVSVSDSNGSLAFFPNMITAEVNTVVQFQFHPKNHTVTESSFSAPCKPLAANLTTPTRPGTKSGFVPVSPNAAEIPVFNMLINDTKPMWIYCGQVNHCEKGMSMVINQNMSDPVKTLANYQAAAAQIPLVPEASPSAGSTSGGSGYGGSGYGSGSGSSAGGSSSTVAPPPPFGSVAATQAASSPSPPASTTVAPFGGSTTSSAGVGTFTGAAARANVASGSGVLAAVVAGLFAML